MAESPQGLHDSRFSGLGPHTTTRGASAPAVLGDLAAAERRPDRCRVLSLIYAQTCPCVWALPRERQARRRNGLRLWSSGSCPSMMVRCKPGPMYGDFPACLTLFVCKPPRGANHHIRSAFSRLGGHCRLPSSALSIAISLEACPPFSPLVPGGSSCRGLPIGAWDWCVAVNNRTKYNTEKHLWLDSL